MLRAQAIAGVADELSEVGGLLSAHKADSVTLPIAKVARDYVSVMHSSLGSAQFTKRVEESTRGLLNHGAIKLREMDLAMLIGADASVYSTRRSKATWRYRVGCWEFELAVLAAIVELFPKDPLSLYGDEKIDRLPDT